MIIKSDYIRDRLSFIESKVKNDTKQKLYDINKTAEDIFMYLLNDVYGWQLVNANDIKPNFPAIDLIDTTNEIVIQVTSSMDDAKVVSTIEKFAKFADDSYKDGAYKQYADYDLKMFYIKEKPDKFSKSTQTKIENQGMSADDFLGIEDINTEVSANPDIAHNIFRLLCKLFHDKVCDFDISLKVSKLLDKELTDIEIKSLLDAYRKTVKYRMNGYLTYTISYHIKIDEHESYLKSLFWKLILEDTFKTFFLDMKVNQVNSILFKMRCIYVEEHSVYCQKNNIYLSSLPIYSKGIMLDKLILSDAYIENLGACINLESNNIENEIEDFLAYYREDNSFFYTAIPLIRLVLIEPTPEYETLEKYNDFIKSYNSIGITQEEFQKVQKRVADNKICLIKFLKEDSQYNGE